MFAKYKISLIVSFVLTILIVILKVFFDNCELSDGIITEMIGIIVTVLFVEILFNYSDEKKAQEVERKKILRLYKLIDVFLPQYIEAFNQLASHPNETKGCIPKIVKQTPGNVFIAHDGSLPFHKPYNGIINAADVFSKADEIKFVNISDMFGQPLMTEFGSWRSKIDIFYYYEKKLLQEIDRIVTEINGDFYPEIVETCLNFSEISKKNNIEEFLSTRKHVVLKENEPAFVFDTKFLLHSEDSEYRKANPMLFDMGAGQLFQKPYRGLLTALKEERKLLKKLQLLVKELNNE
jgi:hypothetical protein